MFVTEMGADLEHYVYLEDGSKRPATELDILRAFYPPEDSLQILQERDDMEAGAEACEQCREFHPDLKWIPGPDSKYLLCPYCVQDFHDYWEYLTALSQGYLR